MSMQQQCLPLTRRRKRNANHGRNTKVGNKEQSNDHASFQEDDEEMNDMQHMPTHISDLSEMDASAYLASVSAQASRLPSVFVAAAVAERKSTANTTASCDTTTSTHPSRNTTVKERDNNEATWQGSVTSVQYLYSNRLKIIPPPTIYHIPPIVRDEKVSMQEYTNTLIHDFSELRLFLHNSLNNSSNSSRDVMNIEDGENKNDEEEEDDDIGAIFSGTFQKKEKHSSRERKVPVPPSKDSYNWHIFCLGKQEACGNIGGYYDVSDDEQLDEEMNDITKKHSDNTEEDGDEEPYGHQKEQGTTACSNTSGQEHVMETKPMPTVFDVRKVPPNGYEPTTPLLCQFDQIIIRRVINHHLHYLCKGSQMTKQRGKWIYALLARLEKPLHRDEASCLTSLLRELCRIRSELKVEDLKDANDDDLDQNELCRSMDEDVEVVKGLKMDGVSREKDVLAILNTLIVIIGIYFEQCTSLDIIMKLHIL